MTNPLRGRGSEKGKEKRKWRNVSQVHLAAETLSPQPPCGGPRAVLTEVEEGPLWGLCFLWADRHLPRALSPPQIKDAVLFYPG